MRLLAALLFALAAAAAWGAEVAGVTLPASEQVFAVGPALVLNGAGLRRKFIFKVYVIGLYLPHKASTAEQALALAGPKRIDIRMLRDVSAQEFTNALFEGLRANESPSAMRAIEPRAERLAALMATLKEARDGMRIALDWLPGQGTRVAVDGKPIGDTIPGEDFYRALLGIWLGPHPVQADLKSALLGAPN
ncbi:MAG TPA: chalcone isomerase family protein [Burkholderiales bacterium]|nr:chalcone isomerase family protein [Burkholderiales bacterium]